jgi:transposase
MNETCLRCGKPLEQPARGRRRKWCSRRCRDKAAVEGNQAATKYATRNEPKRRRAGMLRSAGYGFTEIAAQLSISDRTVRRWLGSAPLPEAQELERVRRGAERSSRSRRVERPGEIPGVIWVRASGAWLRATVDAEDWPRLHDMNWSLTANRYASANVNGRREYLHRIILGLTPGQLWPDGSPIVVDHLNRDPLDNRKANLKAGTYADNCANRGGIFENARITTDKHKVEVRRLIDQGLSSYHISKQLDISRNVVIRLRAQYESAA